MSSLALQLRAIRALTGGSGDDAAQAAIREIEGPELRSSVADVIAELEDELANQPKRSMRLGFWPFVASTIFAIGGALAGMSALSRLSPEAIWWMLPLAAAVPLLAGVMVFAGGGWGRRELASPAARNAFMRLIQSGLGPTNALRITAFVFNVAEPDAVAFTNGADEANIVKAMLFGGTVPRGRLSAYALVGVASVLVVVTFWANWFVAVGGLAIGVAR